MNKKPYVAFLIGFITYLGFSIHPAAAATATSTSGAVYSCPSYGQSIVDVSLSGPSGSVMAGTDVPLTVYLRNLTKYPLAGGAVIVRFFSNSFTDKALASAPQHILLERFFPVTGITIAAGDTQKYSFPLTLRSKLPGGSYTAIVSYVTSTQFNAENPDAPFDQISGSNAYAFTFKVIPTSQDNKSLVYFDSKSLAVGEPKDGSVTATIDLVNASPEAVTVPVLWKLNYWNYRSADTSIKSSVVSATVPAFGRKKLSYTLDASQRSAYQVIAQTEYAGIRSFATFSVEGTTGESVVRFMSLAPFPGTDQPSTVFGCVSNTFSDTPDNGTLYVTVSAADGSVLDRGIFAIQQGPEFAFRRQVDLKGKTNVTVSADVFSQQGGLAQHFELAFDCANPDACPTAAASGGSFGATGLGALIGRLPYGGVALFAGGIAGLLVIVAVVRKRRRQPPTPPLTTIS